MTQQIKIVTGKECLQEFIETNPTWIGKRFCVHGELLNIINGSAIVSDSRFVVTHIRTGCCLTDQSHFYKDDAIAIAQKLDTEPMMAILDRASLWTRDLYPHLARYMPKDLWMRFKSAIRVAIEEVTA